MSVEQNFSDGGMLLANGKVARKKEEVRAKDCCHRQLLVIQWSCGPSLAA